MQFWQWCSLDNSPGSIDGFAPCVRRKKFAGCPGNFFQMFAFFSLMCSFGYVECSSDKLVGKLLPEVRKKFAQFPKVFKKWIFSFIFSSTGFYEHIKCSFDNTAKCFCKNDDFFGPMYEKEIESNKLIFHTVLLRTPWRQFDNPAWKKLPEDEKVFHQSPRNMETKENFSKTLLLFKIFQRTRRTEFWRPRWTLFDKRQPIYCSVTASKKNIMIDKHFFKTFL